MVEIVNDDMPFLVDSVGIEINRLGYTQLLVVHPLFETRRDKDGNLQSVAAAQGEGALWSR